MHVLIVTIAGHPLARRMLGQARALHERGHQVTLAAPFGARQADPPGWCSTVDLPRASGWRHRDAVLAARSLIWVLRGRVDIAVLHDPEQRMHILLAEPSQARRFSRPHTVVPNTRTVPDRVPAPGTDRVVALGDITAAAGAGDLLEAARRLRRHGIRTELIGAPERPLRPLLEAAVTAGTVEWSAAVPPEREAERIGGALAGLCLRRDGWPARLAAPGEMLAYLAAGLPVVCTPLPRAAGLVRDHRCGIVVPFTRPESAVRAVLALRDDEVLRRTFARRAHQAARRDHHWPDDAAVLVAQLERWAAQRERSRPA